MSLEKKIPSFFLAYREPQKLLKILLKKLTGSTDGKAFFRTTWRDKLLS
jgi:hypothetical protein